MTGLEVTMRFPPSSLKLKGELALKNAEVEYYNLRATYLSMRSRFEMSLWNFTAALCVNFVPLRQIMLVSNIIKYLGVIYMIYTY